MRYLIFRNLLKEEARLHTSLYGQRSFWYFPGILFLFTLFLVLSYGWLQLSFSADSLLLAGVLVFFTSGAMNGAFGLYAQDFLERRFGEFGKLFSNLQLLPVSMKRIFLMTAYKEIAFYCVWFLLPIFLGIGIGVFFYSGSLILLPIMYWGFFSAFVLGVSLTFFLSVLAVKFRRWFVLAPLLLVIGVFYWSLEGFVLLSWFFPPAGWILGADFLVFLRTLVLPGLLFLLSVLSIGREFSTRRSSGSAVNSRDFLGSTWNPFVVKEFTDMQRTGALVAKPFFNIFLPSLLLLLGFTSASYFTNLSAAILLFAIIAGTLSTSLMSALISSDSMRYYVFLPVSMASHITPKITLSLVVGGAYGLVLLVAYALINAQLAYLFQAVLLYFGYFFYNLGVSFYLSGLNPYEYLLSAGVFLVYAVLLVPVLMIGMIVGLLFPGTWIIYPVWFLLMVASGWLALTKGFKKWQAVDEVR